MFCHYENIIIIIKKKAKTRADVPAASWSLNMSVEGWKGDRGKHELVPLNWEGGKSCWTSSVMIPGSETPREQHQPRIRSVSSLPINHLTQPSQELCAWSLPPDWPLLWSADDLSTASVCVLSQPSHSRFQDWLQGFNVPANVSDDLNRWSDANVLSKSKGAKRKGGRGLSGGSHTKQPSPRRPEFTSHLIPSVTNHFLNLPKWIFGITSLKYVSLLPERNWI